MLLQRRPEFSQPQRPLISAPIMRVAVPAGIGDSVWALMKIPDMLNVYGAEKARVALCGGVFQNRILTQACATGLKEAGMVPILPGEVPVGDGGLALGQLAVAAARIRGEAASLEWR